MIKNYFYKLLATYLSLYIRPDNSVIEINPLSNHLATYFNRAKVLFIRKNSKDNSYSGNTTLQAHVLPKEPYYSKNSQQGVMSAVVDMEQVGTEDPVQHSP